MEAAASALARRSRSASELRIWLAQRRYPKAEIARAVARMRELGYLDDAEYAATFAVHKAASRGWGPDRVRQELARRGVESEIIEEALARAAEQGASPSANIGRALAKYVRLHGVPRDLKGRGRLVAALRRQGFGLDAIREALAEGFGDDTVAEAGGDESVAAAGEGDSVEEP